MGRIGHLQDRRQAHLFVDRTPGQWDTSAHDGLLVALARSTFRSRFHLCAREREYLEQKGIDVVLQHARRFVEERLAPAQPANDGRQTPMRNHPVFVAQHATATCCRKCLAKWHGIASGRPLEGGEIDYVVSVIGHWLRRQQIT